MAFPWPKRIKKEVVDIWKSVWSAETIQSPLHKDKADRKSSTSIHHPSFSELFTYRYFDTQSKLFFNTNSCGLVYQILPLTGANETIAEQLDEILRSKVRDDFSLQVLFVKHNKLGFWIDEYAKQFEGSNLPALEGVGKQLSKYYKDATKNGFKTHSSAQASLKHTECFVIIDCKKEGGEEALKAKFSRFSISFEAALRAAKIGFTPCDAVDFIRLLQLCIANNPHDIYPPRVQLSEEESLNYQLNDVSAGYEPRKDRLEIYGQSTQGQGYLTEASVLTLAALPDSYELWRNIDNSNNVFEPNQSIQCNHIISVIYKVDDQAKALQRTNRKARDFSNKAQSAYAKNVAGTEKQASTWNAFREELSSHKTSAVRMLYNVILFSREGEVEEDVESAISVYAYNGLKLAQVKNMVLPYFLVSLPFMYTNHLEKDFSLPRMMWKISSFNAVQYMPILSDWSGLQKGILMPGMRDQFSLINPFDDAMGTNYNMAVTGTAGGGKSFAVQKMLLNVLFNGGDVFVIDIGGSYKKLCQILGGTYLEYKNLALNPFTNVSDIFKDIDDIVDLFELLSCPRNKASDDDRGTLREAIINAFEKSGQNTIIDEVVENLLSLYETSADTYPSARILAKNLKPYCAGSEHGRVFNEPSKLSPDARFIAIELQEIEDNLAIRTPALLSVISQIQRRMFQSDRSRQKMCIIDEAWSFFSGDPIATKFIIKGFRTGRKHKASFVTITQGIADYYKFEEARATWDNSSLKLIFKQDNAALQEHNKHHDTFNDYEMRLLEKFPKAKDAGFSQVLIKSSGVSSCHRLFVDPFTRVLLSSDGDDFSAVDNLMTQGLSITDAILQVAYPQQGGDYVQN